MAAQRALVLLVVVGFLALAVLGCDGAGKRQNESPSNDRGTGDRGDRWNLVVILSDTHRADFAPPFEGPRPPTPRLDQLAAESLVFTAVTTPVPISAPAYASLFTGLPPLRHGLLNNSQTLASDLPVLPELFADAGFHTGAVMANYFCGARFGFSRGFDFFWDDVKAAGKEGHHVVREVEKFLDLRPVHEPFFLFVGLMDAHSPYVTPETPAALSLWEGDRELGRAVEDPHELQRIGLRVEPGQVLISLRPRPELVDEQGRTPLFLDDPRVSDGRVRIVALEDIEPSLHGGLHQLGSQARLVLENPTTETVALDLLFHLNRRYEPEEIPAAYARGIVEVDRAVGGVLDSLQRRRLGDRTVVVFVSDHGEMLGEHDTWGHVGDLWQETLRVPLLVRAPFELSAVDPAMPLELTDLQRWLAELTESTTSGWSPQRRGDTKIAATFPPESPRPMVALLDGDLKVLVAEDAEPQVFDLALDPAERNNQWPTEDQGVREHVERASSILIHLIERGSALDLDSLDPEARRLLESLGYL